MELEKLFLNKRITGIYHNYIDRSLCIYLDDKTNVTFYNCALVFDLGIIGHIITYVSCYGTLGMSFELKRMKEDSDDYNFLLLSRDIEDIKNKNEILISYKEIKVGVEQ